MTNWHRGWARNAYDPGFAFERLLAAATVEQRCLLGWPAPGHRYWYAGPAAAHRKVANHFTRPTRGHFARVAIFSHPRY